MRIDPNTGGTGEETLRYLGLTLMYPCFGQEKRISRLLEGWDAWSYDIKDHVKIILIDDHGTPSIESMLSGRAMDYDISVYRIQDDMKYNIPGAMNLGMMVATTPWILTMDTDYSFPLDDMWGLLNFRPRKDEVYSFFLDRVIAGVHQGRDTRVHTNIFLLHKDVFTDLNGFDEDFSGPWSNELQPALRELGGSSLPAEFSKDIQGYGYHDSSFLHKLQDVGYTYVRQHGYVVTEWVDNEAMEYTAVNRRLCKGIYNAKRQGKLPYSTDMLRFKWKQVRHNRRST